MQKSFVNLYFFYRGCGNDHKTAIYNAKLEMQLIKEIEKHEKL